LGFTIGLVDRPTLRTGSPSVMRIDGTNRDTLRRRPIGHELAKLSKGPPAQTVALRPSRLNPLANVRPIFDRNPKAGTVGGSNNHLGKAVVGVPSRPLSAEFPHTPLGSFAATPLQTGATKGEILPGRALAAHEGNLHSLNDRPDAHGVVGNQAEDAIIVGLGGALLESNETAGVLLRRDAGRLSRKSELFPQFVVDTFLQGRLALRARLEAALRNRPAASIAAFAPIAERLRLLWRHRRPDGRNEFHTLKDEMMREPLQRRSAFLPRLKSRACSAEVL
jgi:hypothetical protein